MLWLKLRSGWISILIRYMTFYMQQVNHEIQLEPSWKQRLESEFQTARMKNLNGFLTDEIGQGKTIFPKSLDYFAAFNSTPFDQVKVVIVGQDPYHGPGQAHGLSFSVPEGIRVPPSLQNIFKELSEDLNIPRPTQGHLGPWAQQGVLLLNSVLTVEQGLAGSHQKKGWEEFTDQVIHRLNDEKEHVAFLLWGSYAQKKAHFVDRQKHLVLESVHPSPLSAHRGFFGTKPFSKINSYLKAHGLKTIDWTLN